jgi:HAD superfamily hydrolase (TIGR01509 family)
MATPFITTARVAHKKNFLFDLDGTLIDSNCYHELAFKRTLAMCYRELEGSFDYESVKGRNTRKVFKDLGVTDEKELLRLVERKQRIYRYFLKQGYIKLTSGALPILNFLRENDGRLFVVTGASRQSALASLKRAGIEEYFKGIVTSEDVKYNKPHPEIVLRCIDKYRLAIDDSLMIEDSVSGIKAAQEAGVDVITVNTQEVSDTTVPSFADFHRLLDFFLKERNAIS